MTDKDIIICGVGGQGTVLASKLIAAAAMSCGHTAHSAETIGMAQRGGSVTSHIRIGDNAYSPLVPFGNADMLIAFEPSEAVRNLRYLKKDGIVLVNSVCVKPTTESLRNTGYDGTECISYLKSKCECIVIDANAICEPYGSSKFFNVAVLGVAVGTGRTGLDPEKVRAEIINRVPERFRDTNLNAFNDGMKIGESYAVK